MEISTNGSDFIIMIDEPVSMIGVLSVTAIITTVSLFFCGIPICLEIWNRGKTDEISGFPFLMGFLGGAFWLRYGMLRADLTMIIVNVVGVSLMMLYILFYIYYTPSKNVIVLETAIVITAVLIMLVLVHVYQIAVVDQLGFVCMTFNIINFGAPLAGLAVVFRKKSCDTLPLPLCSANLLVSSQWCLYGVLVHDKYVIIPNGAGILLALLQLSLFLVFPRNENSRAPLAICFPWLNNLEREKQDQPVNSASSMRNGFIVNGGFNWPAQRGIAIPPSRNACIEFLRSSAFNSGGYYVYPEAGNSIRSQITAEFGETITTNVLNSSLSGVMSISHPELWQPTENAIAVTARPYNCKVNEAFNCSYASNAFNCSRNSDLFSASRNSGHVNPLAASHNSAISQYFQHSQPPTSVFLQLQDMQLRIRQQQQQQQQQQQERERQTQDDTERPPSQQEHLLCHTQYEFERVCEMHELERHLREAELKRTFSAPNLITEPSNLSIIDTNFI